jgi:hypothetical protein
MQVSGSMLAVPQTASATLQNKPSYVLGAWLPFFSLIVKRKGFRVTFSEICFLKQEA